MGTVELTPKGKIKKTLLAQPENSKHHRLQ